MREQGTKAPLPQGAGRSCGEGRAGLRGDLQEAFPSLSIRGPGRAGTACPASCGRKGELRKQAENRKAEHDALDRGSLEWGRGDPGWTVFAGCASQSSCDIWECGDVQNLKTCPQTQNKIVKNGGEEEEDGRMKRNEQVSSSALQMSTLATPKEERREDKEARTHPTNPHPRSWAAPGPRARG